MADDLMPAEPPRWFMVEASVSLAASQITVEAEDADAALELAQAQLEARILEGASWHVREVEA